MDGGGKQNGTLWREGGMGLRPNMDQERERKAGSLDIVNYS